MKKISKYIILLIILFSITIEAKGATYYVTGDGVRVRSSAENADNIIGKVNYGDILDVVGLENSWYKIKYGNGYGYVTYRYVSVVDNYYTSKKIALLKENTTLKSSTSTTSKIISSIPKASVVKVLKEKSNWTLVEYNENIGYVETKYLKKFINKNEFAVGTYTVNYSLSNDSRRNNILKSAKKLNTVVIKDGEKFSFLKQIGKSGYLNAPEFNKNDKVYGGGISQVATSLYLSLRDAQRNGCHINVKEQNRYNYKTPYAKLGEEVMIDIKNNKDLVFINKSGKTIKIYSKVIGNSVSFVITEY